jgi:hypothetical protein
LAIALLVSACDAGPAEPPSEFPFASATPECGPADGPAVTIYLLTDTMPTRPPSGAHVRVYVWHGLHDLRGQSWTVGGDSQDGFADYQDGTGAATPLRGTVTVTRVLADSIVEGEVALTSEGVFSVRGGFRANWIPRALLCG